jgi:predicted cupin superfamily sugar epimerase
VVPAGVWQAARSTGAYTLVSCVVGPGFTFEDFSMLRDAPEESARVVRSCPDAAPYV